jgi:threonyl-tRNA synthetase
MEMEDYSPPPARPGGLLFVNTRTAAKGALFEDVGHLELVRRRHVPAMQLDAAGTSRGRLLPQADELPDAQPGVPIARRSYRELPLRPVRVRHRLPLREVGRRATGCTRARGFTQDDAHIYCTREQMQGELTRCSTSCSRCCATTA